MDPSLNLTQVAPQLPSGAPEQRLAPPTDNIYPNFEELLLSIQQAAKHHGYGIVKLRASNYRDNRPTRYDLVCDRGGVKYNSTAKKRNPSTRKVDCPWRAKAVCEVQLGNQWRFVVQDARHNHEPRITAALAETDPNAMMTPVIQSFLDKLSVLQHNMNQNFGEVNHRIDLLQRRIYNLDRRLQEMQGLDPNRDGLGMSTEMDNGTQGNIELDARLQMDTGNRPPLNLASADDIQSRLLANM